MNSVLLNYYEAIEKASQDMLDAAREGNWDHVVKLEGACALLIAQLKNTAAETPLPADEAQLKSRLMQRILRQRRRNPPARRTVARGPRRHPRRPPQDPALIEPTAPSARIASVQGDAMETRPAPLQGMSADDGLDEFRVSSPREVGAAAQAAARRLGAAQPERQRRPRLHERDLDARQHARHDRLQRRPERPGDAVGAALARSHRRRLPRERQGPVRRARTWCWCTATRRAC